MLKVNEYGERQAKGNEKNLCFKGWETLVNNPPSSAFLRVTFRQKPNLKQQTLSLQNLEDPKKIFQTLSPKRLDMKHYIFYFCNEY